MEPVFIAATVDEADAVEQLLDAESIAYEITVEPHTKSDAGRLCLNGVLFQVGEGEAERCRRLFQEHGLACGIVD